MIYTHPNITRQERIKIVDDSPAKRAAWKAALEEDGYRAEAVDGQFSLLEPLVEEIMNGADAAVCDHDLSPGNFSRHRGAEVVAELNRLKFPAILVTRYSMPEIENIRPFRRHIPVLLTIKELSEGIEEGYFGDWLQVCRDEFAEKFLPSRKPRRTLIQVIRVHEDSPFADIILASWNSDQAIKIPILMIPDKFHYHIKEESYFYAMVNTGAESQEELFFTDFEPVIREIQGDLK